MSTDALRVPASLQRRLVPDYLERADASGPDTTGNLNTDFSVAEQLLQRQREVLSYLMSEALADRLADNQDKVRDREPQALTANEVHQRLQKAIWSPAGYQAEQSAWLRNLQREYVTRISVSLLKTGAGRADARAVIREQAKQTLARLKGQRIPAGPGEDAAVWQAHRQDCIETLERALQSSVVRALP